MDQNLKTEIRPAVIGDASAVAEAHYGALEINHPFFRAIFKLDPRDIISENTVRSLKDEKTHCIVAVDSATQSVVGFIRYRFVAASDQSEAVPVPTTPDTPPEPPLFDVKDHLKDLWERYQHPREDEMDACYEKTANGQRHLYVKQIMIAPRYQRKGIGGKLLREVIAISQVEYIPVFLVASAEATGLYLKLGFEDLGTWTIDNAYWAQEIATIEKSLGIAGNEGLPERFRGIKEVEKCMVRWPVKE